MCFVEQHAVSNWRGIGDVRVTFRDNDIEKRRWGIGSVSNGGRKMRESSMGVLNFLSKNAERPLQERMS